MYVAQVLKSHSDKVVHVVQLRSGLLCSSSIDCTIRVWTWITPDKASSMHALIVGPCLEPSLYKKRVSICVLDLKYSYMILMHRCMYVYISMKACMEIFFFAKIFSYIRHMCISMNRYNHFVSSISFFFLLSSLLGRTHPYEGVAWSHLERPLGGAAAR